MGGGRAKGGHAFPLPHVPDALVHVLDMGKWLMGTSWLVGFIWMGPDGLTLGLAHTLNFFSCRFAEFLWWSDRRSRLKKAQTDVFIAKRL
jgi:hypothetical protein